MMMYVTPGDDVETLAGDTDAGVLRWPTRNNGTANHAEHAKGSRASQRQDDAFDLQARLAEVE
jgi:hypothetical protein